MRHLAEGAQIYALIVDDVATNREIMETMLHKTGVETQTAERGEEALASVRQRMPDAVLLDIRLPGMGGDEVLKHLLEEYDEAAPRIVAVTASVLNHERKGILDQGFDDFIDKPLHATQLYACLAEHLGVALVYDEKVSQEALTDWRDDRIPAMLYAESEEAVITHSITRLTDLLDSIAADAPALWAHLRGLAANYDMNGVKAILAEIKTQ